MATVYKAYDVRMERNVAVKVIRTDLFGKAVIERILKRFEREAKAVAKLSHPNIVGLIDYGEYEGEPYLVLEYLPGGTLKEWMNGKPIPWQEAVRLVIPIANALEYAHEQKIIHRDVKPDNILLTIKGEPMLSDFGIAKTLELEDGHTLTGTGVGVGTPEYMSPEQGMGREVDERTDVYSMGIILYELITGRKPFIADTPMAVVLKHMTDPLPSPHQFVRDLPKPVEQVLLKALAKDPNDRYPDAGALAAAMEGLTGRKQTVAIDRKKTKGTAEELSATMDIMAIAQPAKISQPGKRKNFPVWIGFSLGVIALGVVGVVMAMVLVNSLAKNRNIAEVLLTSTQILIPTNIVSQTPASTDRPTAMIVPVATLPQKSFSTPRATVKPALGIGSTMTGNDGMTMLYVPAGNFTMGSNDGGENEKPVHSVFLDAFWIDQTEVTNDMYALCVRTGDCKLPARDGQQKRIGYYSDAQYANYPVVNVSWDDAQIYCSWTNRRLPFEAEWEKAARGVDERTYPPGNWAPNGDWLNFDDGRGLITTKVGSYPAGVSPYGVLDMAGNAWEWVADWYDSIYYQTSPNRNPIGPPSGDSRVLRGGAWGGPEYLYVINARSAYRSKSNPLMTVDYIGFRCAQSAQ